MKKDKARPGTAAELAEQYPGPRMIPVRLVRIEGMGRERRVFNDPATVTVYALPIQQLGRLGQVLAPIANALATTPNIWTLTLEHEDEIMAAVSEAIGWDIAEVGTIHSSDFVDVVKAIMEENADFFVRLLGPQSDPATKAAGANGDGRTPSDSSGGGETLTPSDIPSPSSTRQ
jgi:hypothetical protein